MQQFLIECTLHLTMLTGIQLAENQDVLNILVLPEELLITHSVTLIYWSLNNSIHENFLYMDISHSV